MNINVRKMNINVRKMNLNVRKMNMEIFLQPADPRSKTKQTKSEKCSCLNVFSYLISFNCSTFILVTSFSVL